MAKRGYLRIKLINASPSIPGPGAEFFIGQIIQVFHAILTANSRNAILDDVAFAAFGIACEDLGILLFVKTRLTLSRNE
jgi:hypothetical protein